MKSKAAPRSRLLATLEEAIKKATSPIDAQCLRAERAALLARQGQLERAQSAIGELNAQLAWQPHNTVVRGWVALAEGLHGYYSVIGIGGHEQLELAYKLAQGSGPSGKRLRATTAAWLANLAFGDEEDARMALLIREALDTAAPEHRGALARATLVAGYAYHFGGQSARAQPWYDASRRHAIAEGDEAHLSALMYNQAWARGAQVRMAMSFNAAGPDDGDTKAMTQALIGVESVGHYDAGIGTASLGSLVPTLRAQVLTAQGRWAEALDLFEANFEDALAEGLKRTVACLLADRALCEWHQGRADKARALAGAAEQALAEPIDTDDRSLALARLAQVRDALGEHGTAARHREESQRLYAQHCEQQQRMIALLDEALAGLDPKQL
jgi:hypothetical protein